MTSDYITGPPLKDDTGRWPQEHSDKVTPDYMHDGARWRIVSPCERDGHNYMPRGQSIDLYYCTKCAKTIDIR